MFFHQVVQLRIHLVVGKRNAQDFRLIRDMCNQCTAAKFNIIWMSAKEKDLTPEEGHIMVHVLFGCHEAADHFCHDKFSLSSQAFACHSSDLVHQGFKFRLAVEETGPKFAIFG